LQLITFSLLIKTLDSYEKTLKQGSATYHPRPGSGPPSKIVWPATPLSVVVCLLYGCLVVLHFMTLLSLQRLVLHMYEQLFARILTLL